MNIIDLCSSRSTFEIIVALCVILFLVVVALYFTYFVIRLLLKTFSDLVKEPLKVVTMLFKFILVHIKLEVTTLPGLVDIFIVITLVVVGGAILIKNSFFSLISNEPYNNIVPVLVIFIGCFMFYFSFNLLRKMNLDEQIINSKNAKELRKKLDK